MIWQTSLTLVVVNILWATGNENKWRNRSSLKKKKMIDWAVTQCFIVGRAPISMPTFYTKVNKTFEATRIFVYCIIRLISYFVLHKILIGLDFFFYVGSKARLHVFLFLLNAESRRTKEWTSRHPLQHTHSGLHRKQERASYIPCAIQLFLWKWMRKKTNLLVINSQIEKRSYIELFSSAGLSSSRGLRLPLLDGAQ